MPHHRRLRTHKQNSIVKINVNYNVHKVHDQPCKHKIPKQQAVKSSLVYFQSKHISTDNGGFLVDLGDHVAAEGWVDLVRLTVHVGIVAIGLVNSLDVNLGTIEWGKDYG